MNKRNVCRTATLLCGLLAILIHTQADTSWPINKLMGTALVLVSAIFGTQWAEYQKRHDATSDQPGTPAWLRRLLFSSLLLLTMTGANAQTTWTNRPQTSNRGLSDIAYGAGRYVAVGGDGGGEFIRTSPDGITWTTQVEPTTVGLYSIVYAGGLFVTVGGSGRVLTSPDGLTWTSQVSGLGVTSLLAGIAYGGGQFMAVGFDGVAITSPDGVTWTTLTTGVSTDFLNITYGGGKFIAVGKGGLIRTTLNGIIWTDRISGTSVDLRGVTVGSNGRLVAVGENSTIVTSADGITWTKRPGPGTLINLWAVAFNPTTGKYVAVANASNQVLTSPDGLDWGAYQSKSGTDLVLLGVRYINGQFVAVGEDATIRSSTSDGIAWNPMTITGDVQFSGVAYGNGHYVAVGKYPISLSPAIGSVAATSTDGANYVLGTTEHFAGAGEGFHDVVFGNGQFVAVGGEAIIQTSVDGKAWKLRHSGFGASVNGVAYGNGQYVAVGAGFGAGINLLRSPDGITWTKSANGLPAFYAGITHANGQFVAVGFNGAIATSPDGSTWTAHSSGTSNLLRSVAYGNGAYVAVGIGGAVSRSVDGNSWTVVPSFTSNDINHVTFGNGQFVIVGEDGELFTSANGTTWTARVSSSNSKTLRGVTHGNGLFVAVGDEATVVTSPNDGGQPPVNPGAFAITGVTLVSCNAISAAQRQLVFSPQYAGLSGQPISFEVVNEMVPTTNPGPYSLNIYTDNPSITLKATQSGTAGEASFVYNWLSVCNGGVPPPPGNQAPTVVNGIPNQSGTVGQGFSYSIPANTFSDPNNDALTLSVAGLPNGLNLNGSTISGTPTNQGASTVTVTATDGGNLAVSTTFTLTINPVGGNPGAFAIKGVTLVSCQEIAPGKRQLVFTPQYAGTNGQPISFEVVNEMVPTTNPGPYSLGMYIDNPSITLKATQSGTAGEASFIYSWFLACSVGDGARVGTGHSGEQPLSVQVLGNPVENGAVLVEVRGAGGQPVQMNLTDLRGQVVGSHQVGQAEGVEQHTFEIGQQPAGLYLLRVSTLTQMRTLKVLKR